MRVEEKSHDRQRIYSQQLSSSFSPGFKQGHPTDCFGVISVRRAYNCLTTSAFYNRQGYLVQAQKIQKIRPIYQHLYLFKARNGFNQKISI